MKVNPTVEIYYYYYYTTTILVTKAHNLDIHLSDEWMIGKETKAQRANSHERRKGFTCVRY